MFFFEKYSWIMGALIFMARYLCLAGTVYFVFYIWKKKQLSVFKIQPKFPQKQQLKTELFFSLLTLLIYSGTAGMTLFFYSKGMTKIYLDLNEYGIGYLLFSIFAMVFIHDAYFYWTHKLMHQFQWLYKFHSIHHRSHSPTPWAAFSFHPIEAIISLGIIPLIIFVLPVHPMALMIFLTIMTIYNILVHLGYEVLTKTPANHPVGKWHNTTTNHDLHHEIGGRFNYGFYFTLWDRWMGTYREKSS